MDEAHLSFQYDGKAMEMVFSTLVHASSIVQRLEYNVKRFIHSLDARVGPTMYIVDVGASTGLWTIPFALYFPKAKILAIEPSKYNYPYLKQNCKNYPNIKTLKMAVSDTQGQVTIASPTSAQRDRSDLAINTGLISVYGKSDNFQEEVEIDTLDNIVKSHVDWLKIDVEGHEKHVLDGAKNILKNHRPLLQIEMRSQTQQLAKGSTFALAYYISSYNYTPIGAIDEDWIFIPQEKL